MKKTSNQKMKRRDDLINVGEQVMACRVVGCIISPDKMFLLPQEYIFEFIQ